MGEFIKIPLSKRMKSEYEECEKAMEDGVEKDCSSCSLNGGNLECLGEYQWCSDV